MYLYLPVQAYTWLNNPMQAVDQAHASRVVQTKDGGSSTRLASHPTKCVS